MQRVLIIDDSPEIHALLRARLKGEPVELHFADSGSIGLAMAATVRPDVILLDIHMPEMSGHEVCRRFRASAQTVNTPIIFISGADSPADKIRGLDLGATDYITKPFDPAELRARVRAALRTSFLMDLLARKAMIDGLTGMWNRGYLETRLDAEIALAKRTGRPVSCILIDVDHFKVVNDQFGHPFGDEVLRTIAVTLDNTCRTEDVLCRYGGEEFIVLLPNTAAAGAAELADRMRGTIEVLALRSKQVDVNVTVSGGVAELDFEEPRTVVEAADAALYLAKQSGRNRIYVAGKAHVAPVQYVNEHRAPLATV